MTKSVTFKRFGVNSLVNSIGLPPSWSAMNKSQTVVDDGPIVEQEEIESGEIISKASFYTVRTILYDLSHEIA